MMLIFIEYFHPALLFCILYKLLLWLESVIIKIFPCLPKGLINLFVSPWNFAFTALKELYKFSSILLILFDEIKNRLSKCQNLLISLLSTVFFKPRMIFNANLSKLWRFQNSFHIRRIKGFLSSAESWFSFSVGMIKIN